MGLVMAVIVTILAIGIFTGYDETIFEGTPEAPPSARQK
jgi:hypothetical protein